MHWKSTANGLTSWTPLGQWTKAHFNRANTLTLTKNANETMRAWVHTLVEHYVILMEWHLQMPLSKHSMHKQMRSAVDINQFYHFDWIGFDFGGSCSLICSALAIFIDGKSLMLIANRLQLRNRLENHNQPLPRPAPLRMIRQFTKFNGV